MEIGIEEERIWYVLLLVILLTGLYLTLNVSLTERLVFGDEGYYASRGKWIAENLEIPVKNRIYEEIPLYTKFTRKTPVLFFMASSFYLLAGKMGMRALVPIISIISASMLFLLTKKLHSTKAGVLAVLFYLTMPALITHTVFLYTEHLSLMFLIASFCFLYNYFERERSLHLVISGILLGFSILTEASVLAFLLIYLIILFYYKTGWRSFLKEFLVIALLSFLIISPWMLIHNWWQTGNPGFKVGTALDKIPGVDVNLKDKVMKEELPEIEGKGLKSVTKKGGTASPIYKFGILNYIQFAYTLPIFLFSLLGFSYYFSDRKKKHVLVLAWAILFFATLYLVMGGQGRVEDLSRNSLHIIAPLSIAAGFFGSKIYDYLRNFESTGKTIAVIFLVVLVGWAFFSASSKASSLRPVKHFSDAFYKGTDWIKENTPQDSIIYTIWAQRAVYHAERTFIGTSQPISKALVAANNRSYKVFREYGVDYLFIQKFNIKRGREANIYPLKFIQHIESSPRYKKVYSYPRQCLYKRKISDCIIIYKLVPNETKTERQLQNLPFQQGG